MPQPVSESRIQWFHDFSQRAGVNTTPEISILDRQISHVNIFHYPLSYVIFFDIVSLSTHEKIMLLLNFVPLFSLAWISPGFTKILLIIHDEQNLHFDSQHSHRDGISAIHLNVRKLWCLLSFLSVTILWSVWGIILTIVIYVLKKCCSYHWNTQRSSLCIWKDCLLFYLLWFRNRLEKKMCSSF